MPPRRQVIATNEVYHLVNRGVASLPIFQRRKDYTRFIDLMNFYRFMDNKMSFSRFINMNVELRNDYMSNLKKISRLGTEIFSYCLMPNHYHILLKQLEDDQIRSFISKIQNAFAKYINLKDKRAGPLFQSRFKARWIENEEIFLHTSRYIHLNPSTSFLVKPDELEFYEWSSYPSYLSKDNNEMLEKNLILNISGGVEKYRDFVMNNLDYQRKLYKIKHLLLE